MNPEITRMAISGAINCQNGSHLFLETQNAKMVKFLGPKTALYVIFREYSILLLEKSFELVLVLYFLSFRLYQG
jgi:hypothetical protein